MPLVDPRLPRVSMVRPAVLLLILRLTNYFSYNLDVSSDHRRRWCFRKGRGVWQRHIAGLPGLTCDDVRKSTIGTPSAPPGQGNGTLNGGQRHNASRHRQTEGAGDHGTARTPRYLAKPRADRAMARPIRPENEDNMTDTDALLGGPNPIVDGYEWMTVGMTPAAGYVVVHTASDPRATVIRPCPGWLIQELRSPGRSAVHGTRVIAAMLDETVNECVPAESCVVVHVCDLTDTPNTEAVSRA